MKPEIEIPIEWICRIREREGLSLAKIEEVCANIATKDSAFRYEVGRDKIGQFIDIICATKDEAMRKGDWFHFKVDQQILFHAFERLKRA